MSETIYDQFIRGCDALAEDDHTAARRAFSAVVAIDPEAFDAWLGLHYLARTTPGPILDALVHAADHAGELQAQTERGIASAWSPSVHVRLPLLGARDAHLARTVAHLDADEIELATATLERIGYPSHPPTALIWARVHQRRGQTEAALSALTAAIEDRDCGPEAERVRGLILWGAGCERAALHHLRLAAQRAPHLAARLEARYHEAGLCAAIDDASGERAALELIYAEHPAYGDVAERLFPERANDIIWQRLVRQLEMTPSE